MAKTRRLFYLPESRTSASLEAIRRLLQPASSSLPHITLRYSDRPLKDFAREMYDRARVDDLILDQPSTFDVTGQGGGIRTLVVLCDSDQLEHISYKPDFPQSFLHISLYDGPSSELAEHALDRLHHVGWNWHFRRELVQFSNSRSAGDQLGLRLHNDLWASDGAFELIREFVGIEPSREAIEALPQATRVSSIERIAARLKHSPELEDADVLPSREQILVAERHVPEHGAFWSVSAVNHMAFEDDRETSQYWNKVYSTYVTPPELALDVVTYMSSLLEPGEAVDFGDPAIGSGILFAAARHVLGEKQILSARGVDIDQDSARKTLHRWRRSNLTLTVGDFIDAPVEASSWSFVAANPPYRRSQLLPRSMGQARTRILDELGLRVSARSDLYVYFLLGAHRWMKPGAVAAWIIPAEFQVAEYARPLREYLSQIVTLLRIHTYDSSDRQFDNALTSTSVVVFKNVPPRADQLSVLSDGGTLAMPLRQHVLPLASLRRSKRWNFALLTSDHADVERDNVTVGDLFNVKRGIATGSNDHFVLSDRQVEDLAVERSWIKPLMPRARFIHDSWITEGYDGRPIPGSGLWIIDTEESIDEIRRVSPTFASYLQRVQDEVGYRSLVARRSPIYRQEYRPVAPFVFVYMAKLGVPASRRFIRNDSSAVILNNYLGMYPKANLLSWLTIDPDRRGLLHDYLRQISDEELVMRGRAYGHGLLKVEPRELLQVRLPIRRTAISGISGVLG